VTLKYVSKLDIHCSYAHGTLVLSSLHGTYFWLCFNSCVYTSSHAQNRGALMRAVYTWKEYLPQSNEITAVMQVSEHAFQAE
jgi:hypothetical protein